jgi:hypothetical protein
MYKGGPCTAAITDLLCLVTSVKLNVCVKERHREGVSYGLKSNQFTSRQHIKHTMRQLQNLEFNFNLFCDISYIPEIVMPNSAMLFHLTFCLSTKLTQAVMLQIYIRDNYFPECDSSLSSSVPSDEYHDTALN